jgi:hypothetical protein
MTKLPTHTALLTSTAITPPFNTSPRLPGIDRAAWTSMVASARLPTGELDENRAIDCIAVLIPKMRHKLEKEYSREWLQATLQKGLEEGRPRVIEYAFYAAEAGDKICDAALQYVCARLMRKEIPEVSEHMPVKIYGERALALAQPHKRRSGRRWHDNWIRDIQTCMLIDFVCREFDVHPTRNREHGNRAPSAISLVVAALARNGIYFDEASVQQHIWFGLPGEIVRTELGWPGGAGNSTGT